MWKENYMSEIMVRERFLRSGKKVYEYSFEMASVDGKRKRKSKSGFASKRDARIAGRKALSEYENVGQVMVDRDISYADFLDLWMENDCKLTCKESTLYGYEKKIRLYLKPELGGYRVSSIDKKILQTFITDLYNDGFSINTIISIKGLLTKSFNYALENHYIMTSPANRLVIPQNMQPDKSTRRKEHIYLTKDNIDSLFERFPKGTSSFVPLQIAYHTGMRPGEVFGLVWDDIDFDNKVINVNRQIQWRQVKRSKKDIKKTNGTSESLGYWYFTSSKYKSYRVIDIDDVLVSILKEEYEKQKRDEKYYGEFYKKYYSEFQLLFSVQKNKEKEIPLNEVSTKETDFGVDFVCRREDGSYVTSRTLQNVSNAVHKELDIPGYDTYSLRHTHGTMLIENGADMVYVQRRLGHKNINVTMNIYTNHLTPIIKSRNNITLNNMY
jgi:integrase